MKGEWIRKSKGNTSVIFVHGILSSGKTCWTHKNGSFWPDLLKEEKEFEDWGIYNFMYETGFFSGTYNLSDIVDALKEQLKLDKLLDSKQIAFVCHSMGGIVVRKFIVERVYDFIEQEIKIGLFLVASPSLGSSYANLFSAIIKFVRNSQADILRFNKDNLWLNSLDKEFQNLRSSNKLEIRGKELIEDKFIVLKNFWTNQVVEPFSGARYFGESYKVPYSDHFSIAKPENKDAVQHRLLCEFLNEFFKNKVDKQEKSLAHQIITFLEKRGLLHLALEGNHPEHPQRCYEYANTLREGIITILMKIPRNSQIYTYGDRLHDEFIKFRRELERLGIEAKERETDLTNEQLEGFTKSIYELRKNCSGYIQELGNKYSIDVSDIVSQIDSSLPNFDKLI
ncbi:esterase/lipase family protein [Adhaeribacter pallidiroseus]|uniref:DUF676 domain-containing protein n=1 Tax=Adhaeribacter pallidiroseus TaxID=2072847 RepID=A0A369QFQ0_9BACT|nr:hypothetical protein [Adhaeribacter pallidiroseus]RDC62056.1 hypothetical protein AHMF7616_00647 [Adhaeribacter pallidiroseus]